MFDIGWTEMLVVGIIAIIFVGPKELPGMLRTFGQAIRKIRGMAGEFQGQFNEALKEAELDGLKDTINDVRSLDPTKAIKDKLNPLKDDLEKPVKAEKKIQTPQEIEAEIAENYRKAQEATKNASTGPNAVPGFSSAPTEPASEPKVVASPKKTIPKKTAAKKAPAKKVAPKKAASKKTDEKKTAAKSTAKKAVAKKSVAKSKTKDIA
ncbi:Sec-independent protein translocase protein TatB [Pseudahrensia aquimaris]|uniref:Sec-independent protein translocase protein TatB n=1 Tax=Pseudahrensia aquimaris TaxID=744461 RepID=A0ABW3FLM1_9HYPH